MAILELKPQTAALSQNRTMTDVLDGQRVTFTFFTDRTSWYMNVADAVGTPLISGLRLVGGRVDMLAPYRHLDVPPGILMVVTTTPGQPVDPGYTSFSDGTCQLWYVEADDPLAQVTPQ